MGRRMRSLERTPISAFQTCTSCGRYSHFSVACTAFKDVHVGNKEGMDAGANSQPMLLGSHTVLEILPVYVAEMEEPCLLEIDNLTHVGACIILKQKLRVREKEVPFSLGVAPAEVVMAECVRIPLDTEPKVPYESSRKLAGQDGMTVYGTIEAGRWQQRDGLSEKATWKLGGG